jgi:hypothetical protein
MELGALIISVKALNCIRRNEIYCKNALPLLVVSSCPGFVVTQQFIGTFTEIKEGSGDLR